LSKLRKITEFGVTFRSPRDGQTIDLTPEGQSKFRMYWADVIMAFDESPTQPIGRDRSGNCSDSPLAAVSQLISGLTKRCLDVHIYLRLMLPRRWLLLICLGMQLAV